MNTENTTMTQAQPLIQTLQMTLGAPMSDDPSNPSAIEIPLQIELPNGQTLFAAVALGGLPFDGQRQIAERMAAAWNAFTGVATQEIKAPSRCLHQIEEPAAQAPDDAQIKALMRKHRIWIEHSTLLEDDKPERELRAVQAEEDQFNAFLQDLIAATQHAAVQQVVLPSVPEGEYLEGVHIPTLREALTFLGSENGVGEGEVGAELPKYVNSISRGVLRCKEMLRTATLTLKATLPKEQEDLIEEIIERISDHAECVIAHHKALQQGNTQAIETARQTVFRTNNLIKLDLRKLAAATPHSAEGATAQLERLAVWCDSQAASDWYGRKASDMVRTFAARAKQGGAV